MNEEITNPLAWEKYGLSGLVILALFVTLGFFLKRLMAHQDSQAIAHSDERKEWQDFAEDQTNQHRAERMEWRKDIERFDANMESRDVKLQNTLTTLTTHLLAQKNQRND